MLKSRLILRRSLRFWRCNEVKHDIKVQNKVMNLITSKLIKSNGSGKMTKFLNKIVILLEHCFLSRLELLKNTLVFFSWFVSTLTVAVRYSLNVLIEKFFQKLGYRELIRVLTIYEWRTFQNSNVVVELIYIFKYIFWSMYQKGNFTKNGYFH